MAEIADWSPVDESNNSAPPNGWPENQAPSSVNNCGRAMMGAIRRWYDTITTQLATYLPLSGGTVTGPVAFNGAGGITVGGMQLHNSGLNQLAISHPTQGGLEVAGPNAHLGFADRDGWSASWLWYANGGTAHLLRADGGDIITASWNGAVSIPGTLSVGSTLSVSGGLTIGGGFTVGSVHSLSDVTVDGSLYAAGINCSGNMGLAGALNGNVVNANHVGVAGTLIVGGDSALANVHIAGQIYAIGNDPQFHIKKVGEQRIINFEPNTYIVFDAVTNNLSIVIDGVVKASW